MRFSALMLAAGAALVALTGCDSGPPVYVDQAWVRASPNPQSPSAAYFSIHTGDAPVTLLGVMTESAVRVEMHNSIQRGDMMAMVPLAKVDIPANSEVRFAPGGKHVMLWSLNAAAVQAGKVPMTLLFSNGDRIIVDAVVRKAGDGPPAAH